MEPYTPVVASFSGRGPNGQNLKILKPDLIAPCVNILAAWSAAAGPTGLSPDNRKIEFNILSDTSMACPHVSGAAALLKSAHPDWSPAAIRSAIMTTASVADNSAGSAATPYDYGADHLNMGLAMDPGLVYDLTNDDYVSFLSATEYGTRTIKGDHVVAGKLPRGAEGDVGEFELSGDRGSFSGGRGGNEGVF